MKKFFVSLFVISFIGLSNGALANDCKNIISTGSKKGGCSQDGTESCKDIQGRPGACKTSSQSGESGEKIYSCNCEYNTVSFRAGDKESAGP